MNLTGNKSCFLDTCIVIDIFKDRTLLKNLEKFETVFLSNIVIGELYYGAYTSSDLIKHIRQIEEFISLCLVTCCDETTSIFYGQTKSILKNWANLFQKMIFGLRRYQHNIVYRFLLSTSISVTSLSLKLFLGLLFNTPAN